MGSVSPGEGASTPNVEFVVGLENRGHPLRVVAVFSAKYAPSANEAKVIKLFRHIV